MKLRFLGTGTSYGVPRLGCDCAVCRSPDPRNQRQRASVLFQRADGGNLLIDTTPDLRSQLLAARVRGLDQVLITHFHADHVFGLDDLRGLTDSRRKDPLDLWVPAEIEEAFRTTFPYIFGRTKRRMGIPFLRLRPFEDHEAIPWGEHRIEVLPLPHGRGTTRGFLIAGAAYLTDCHDVPPEVIDRLRGCEHLVLDMLRLRPAPTHLHLARSLEIAAEVGAAHTWFTHLSHEVDHGPVEGSLPSTVKIAFDGLELALSTN